MTERPFPPRELIEAMHSEFAPAHEVAKWVRETFIVEGAELKNDDHAHLMSANVEFLWTNVENVKKGRLLLGQCQLMPPTGDKWSAARAENQIERWFGDMPDFLVTLYAPACSQMTNTAFSALIEHELFHASQATDKFGAPAFNKQTGKPIWAIRGHDVEEFVGVVRRYGATSPELAEMVRLVNKGPEISEAQIARSCGTCLRLIKGG